ncbi:PREDICTED: leucine-rich repeat receptor-like kinase protein FLORAL ORGAN NUMBER1 [Prunus mume]|uniref:Leucine-rich repeat receptor-like kinase protein FLORAL ORGAN NUMBER1 n=1 Tax=Prunus mume TaxID=102107 RepID=A0ABM0PVV2_PRUMU|nr:PREDICTED: leucine-rich repeat receptor-like kinase protein FLORAL ORGAN NUMBER1 [Prunus mume]
MTDVASALEYLHHDRGPNHVVHCDVKPGNILLDDDMVAHVADFGIARLFGEGDSMTQTMTLATIGDVYSFGIVLMETFTRRKPTGEMFVGEMNLKQWIANSLLPDAAIVEVVDADFLGAEEHGRLNIMIDVASALEYLHHGHGYSEQVVHCDGKPNNILLDDDMVAHVADFGIARLLGGGDSMTQIMTLATIGYMAPGGDLIRESGIPYTIVRPCALTEEPAGVDLIFDQGDNITGKISREEVVQICVAALESPYASGKTFEVKSVVPFSDRQNPTPEKDYNVYFKTLKDGITGKEILEQDPVPV